MLKPRPVVFAALVASAASSAACGSRIVTQRSVPELERRKGFSWHRHEAPGFVVQVEDGSHSDVIARSAADTAARARDHLLTYLNEAAFAPVISLFLVRTRGRMADLIGRETNGTAYHASHVVCVVLGEALLSRVTHELFHVIAMNAWGTPPRWVNEGAAVDADTQLRGVDVHALSRRLLDRDALPSLASLARRFGTLPSDVSYVAAGSVVRFVRETYGMDAVRALWDDGLPGLEAHVHVTAASLEARWITRVGREIESS